MDNNTSSIHILVAEDHPVNQRLLVRILERRGMTVDVVADGAAALAAWERNRYDLILMDVMMPVLDGIAATRAIRLAEARRPTQPEAPVRRVPIIGLTALDNDTVCTAWREADMDGCLQKPIAPDTLLNLIGRLVTPPPR